MSIRIRLVFTMTITSAVLVVLGGLFFLHQLSGALTSSVDGSLRSEAASVIRSLPRTPPQTPAKPRNGPFNYTSIFNNSGPDHEDILASRHPGEINYVAQIVNPLGQVVSSDDTGPEALASGSLIRKAQTRSALLATVSAPSHPGGTRLLLVPVSRWRGWLLVLGASLRQRNVAVAGVQRGLLLGGLIAISLVAAGSYIFARVILAPVERLRRQAATLAEMGPEASLEEPRTHDEIARLASTLNLLLAKLRSSLARQRRLVADASHELRTPLAILHGELQLADRPGRSHEDLVAAVHNAAGETRRLVHLGEDLLFLSRSDENSLPVSLARNDIVVLLQHAAEAHAQAASARGVALAVDAGARVTADVDEDHIRRAVDNLVYNALRFSPPGSTITLRARIEASPEPRTSEDAFTGKEVPNGVVIIEVIDEGPGFPAEFLPHAFERFRRPDDSRSRASTSETGAGNGGESEGSGLGLAIVQAIAQAHGGCCMARNLEPAGACVQIQIPQDRQD
ncbi:MAG: ATP-binding protein [Actinomycetota bacterium]|nr:ATP-binding protein [Actinomycetota bacterium]